MEQIILDVREQDEFAAEHIPGSIWVPLSQFGHTAPGVLQSMLGKKILFMCRSGARAKLALAQVPQLGFGGQLVAEVYEGGILRWARQGGPVITGRSGHFPILRQVHITAGAGVLLSVLLGFAVNPAINWFAAFIGAGLLSAGLTGFCGLAKILALMPWNKTDPQRGCSCG